MKKLYMLAATMVLLLASFASQATTIKGGYTVDLNSTDPGLVLHYQDVAPDPFTWNLNVGDSVTFDLFEIWTEETFVNSDDEVAKPIVANFNFILPGAFPGSVGGTTDGGFGFFGLAQFGQVSWTGPSDFYFGALGDGHFRLSLSDEFFNFGFFGLGEGQARGATVQATITLLQGATAVPAPAGLAILGFGLLALGLFLRRGRCHRTA